MKAIYAGIFLDDKSHKALLAWSAKTMGPALEKVLAHHCTLQFKPQEYYVKDLPLGTKVSLTVFRFDSDTHAQAVQVIGTTEPDREKLRLYCYNNIPHITVSTDAETKPVYSNSLLDKHSSKPLNKLVLTGTIGIFTPKGVIFNSSSD
jgi:hypothetical protein